MQVYLRTSDGSLWGLTSSQHIKDSYVTDRLNQLIQGFGKQMAAGNFTSSMFWVGLSRNSLPASRFRDK